MKTEEEADKKIDFVESAKIPQIPLRFIQNSKFFCLCVSFKIQNSFAFVFHSKFKILLPLRFIQNSKFKIQNSLK